MPHGVTIFRLFGIEIRLDPSLIIIFALIAFSLGAGILPHWHPGWSPVLVWGLAILATVLFFLSILAHELSHSLVARSRDIPVRSITLFLLGGVSNIEREPQTAKNEFWMAIVGPLTSLLLGAVLLLISGLIAHREPTNVAGAVHLVRRMGPVTTLLAWLGSINIILGIFNMVPGFPLDGGRVLRALLWRITGDFKKATRWASMVGRGIGWAFIFTGIAMAFGIDVPFFGTGIVGGLWLAFIGWFLSRAAVASYSQVIIEALLRDVAVRQIMVKNVPVVPPGLNIATLIDHVMMQSDQHAFAVIEGESLVGLICIEDVHKVPVGGRETTRVRDVMTPRASLTVVGPDDPASEALKTLAKGDVGQLPVLEDGVLTGFIRRQEILRWIQVHADLEHGSLTSHAS